MNLMMPTMLGWVLGGNTGALRGADRAPHCRVNDKPKAFHEQVLLLLPLHSVHTCLGAAGVWLSVKLLPPVSSVRTSLGCRDLLVM